MLSARIKVFVTTRVVAFHKWPGAPDDCAYLRDLHRHVFHVRGEMPVSHHDRDIEFIGLKLQTKAAIEDALATRQTDTWSCEHWCHFLINAIGFSKVEVSEDGENGAIVEV